ncbi:MAG: hypothetical protein WC317_01600 [Candidatus Omnitrophota bacterium]
MKENISREQLTKEVKEYLAAFSDEELCLELLKEKKRIEMEVIKNLGWLGRDVLRAIIDLPEVEDVVTKKDERKDEKRSLWNSVNASGGNKIPSLPIFHGDFYSEAA